MQVGQAKSDSEESTAQVVKALGEVKAIMDELNSLRDINLDDLDALGKYCLQQNEIEKQNFDMSFYRLFPFCE